jgi:hypothetical protein
MSNDKAAATYHPDEGPPAPPIEPAEDDLPPLSVLVEMLTDVAAQLEGVDELIVAHRRRAGDDHHELERFQYVSTRIGQAWAATVTASRALRRNR